MNAPSASQAWETLRRRVAQALATWPERVGWRDHLVGAGLGLIYTGWLLSGARALGFPRDEGLYFQAGAQYARWWRMVFERGRDALQPGAIDGAFSINHEHPALMKTLFGMSEWFFHQKWAVFGDASTAFRLPGMLSAAVALWVTYLFGARAWSRRAGVVAALLLALMPRVFFHAHLACFDVPIMAMWILCVYVHWRAQEERTLGWAIALGVVFGLALETKHNAWMLPGVLVPHAFFVQRRAIARGLSAGRFSIPLSVLSMATIGPLVFCALWPYLWHDTLARVQWYVEFHLNHEYYNIEFLGKNYFGPPSPKSYLPVMMAATLPTVTLLLAAWGLVQRGGVAVRRLARSATASGAGARLLLWLRRGRAAQTDAEAAGSDRDPRETDLLLVLSLVVPMFFFFLPATPIFGGTKHWLTAYPALALYAGWGFDRLVAAMRRSPLAAIVGGRRWWAAEWIAGACVVAAPLAETAHAFPFGLSSYVPLVGGAAGAADLGLNRQFWGFTSQNAAEEYLNARAPRNATVFIHDTTWDAWGRMEEEGRVRSDLRGVGSPSEASIALVEHELHMNEVDDSIWIAFGTQSPAYVVTHDGVPIVSVYKRP